MNKIKFHLMLMLGLLSSVAIASCSGKDDEPKSGSSTEEIMEYISGRVFSYNDISGDDDSYHDYKHTIMFTATSADGGTFEHECFWEDIYIDGRNHGRVCDEGSFSVSNGKISISIYRGTTWYIKYFTVKGKNLVGDNGDVYQSVGLSSDEDTPTVSTHKYPLEYYQYQYNDVISTLAGNFMEFDTAKAIGDTVKARRLRDEIIILQGSAKEIRKEAKEDGWTIEPSPYETKSAYV